MSWNRVQGATGAFNAGPVTSVVGSFGAAVAVGDTIMVQTCYDDPGSFTDVLTDQLGNTYTLVRRTTNATSQQGSGYYRCKVTVAGTPTITQKFNPTPGTSTGQAVGWAADHFTGSDAASVVDGSNSQAQNAPGTAADALTSTAFTTTVDGDLIWGGFQDCSTNGAIAAGTGFTAGTVMDGGAGNLLLRNVWKVQATHGSVSATATATNGTDNYVSGGAAVTPAAGLAPGDDRAFRAAPLRMPPRPWAVETPPPPFSPRGLLEQSVSRSIPPYQPLVRNRGAVDAPPPPFSPRGLLEEKGPVFPRGRLPSIRPVPDGVPLPVVAASVPTDTPPLRATPAPPRARPALGVELPVAFTPLGILDAPAVQPARPTRLPARGTTAEAPAPPVIVPPMLTDAPQLPPARLVLPPRPPSGDAAAPPPHAFDDSPRVAWIWTRFRGAAPPAPSDGIIAPTVTHGLTDVPNIASRPGRRVPATLRGDDGVFARLASFARAIARDLLGIDITRAERRAIDVSRKQADPQSLHRSESAGVDIDRQDTDPISINRETGP